MSQPGYRVNPMLSKITELLRLPSHAGYAPLPGEKLRVLYIVANYPEFSETYMHEEMASVADEFDLRIVSYVGPGSPRNNHLPYMLLKYQDSSLNWGDFDLVNTDFTNKAQKSFLREMKAIIREFRPHVMHGHYFATSLILRKLADIHNIPFTIRTHSFDMLNRNQKKLDTLCNAVNSPWCLRIFTYPAFRELFIQRGISEDTVTNSWPVINVTRFHNTDKPERTGRILCCGPCIEKKAHHEFIDLADRMRNSGLKFDLCTRGNDIEKIRLYNESKGKPVTIMYSDPEDMAGVYRNHDWLVYTADTGINRVGLPASIIEAQASGIGVCWQELPGRRQEQLEFLGGAGFLFKSIDEVPRLLENPYPEGMRLQGIENSGKCDVGIHKVMLSETWSSLRQDGRLDASEVMTQVTGEIKNG